MPFPFWDVSFFGVCVRVCKGDLESQWQFVKQQMCNRSMQFFPFLMKDINLHLKLAFLRSVSVLLLSFYSMSLHLSHISLLPCLQSFNLFSLSSLFPLLVLFCHICENLPIIALTAMHVFMKSHWHAVRS